MADEETEDDEEDAEPFSPRKLLAEEKEHPDCRKGGADVVESIGAGNADDTDGIAETYKSNDGRPDCQIADRRQRTPELHRIHIGKTSKTRKTVGEAAKGVEQKKGGQLHVENGSERIVFGRNTAQDNRI